MNSYGVTSGRFSVVIAAAIFGMTMHAGAQATNAIPYYQSFEDYADLDGSNIVSLLGWESESEESVVAVSSNYLAPSFRVPVTNHTTIAQVSEPVTIHIDGAEQAGGTVWVDYLVKPKRWEDDAAPADFPEDAQLAMFVDSNGCLNVYHAANNSTSGFADYPGAGAAVWSVIDDPVFAIPDNEWIRLTVNMDFSAADGASSYFQVKINGNLVNHPNAHFSPIDYDYFKQDLEDFGDDAGIGKGTWFPMVILNVATQLNAVSLRGTGLFDDFVVSADEPVVSNIFYHTIIAGVTGIGSIDATSNSVNSLGAVKVLPNQNQTFTWAPAYGQFFDGVTIVENGATNIYTSEEYATGYTFTNVSDNGSVTVKFATSKTFMLEYSATGGTINLHGVLPVVIHESREFTWTNNYGYTFNSVTIGEDGETNVFTTGYETGYTFTDLTNDGSVVVIFDELPTFSIDASSDVNGTIEYLWEGSSFKPVSGPVSVPDGYNQEFRWTAERGYTFEEAIVFENGETNTYNTTSEYTSAYTFSNVTATGSIAVSFSMLPRYTIEASAYNGSIDPAGTSTNIIEGEEQPFTYSPTDGYRFAMVRVVENGVTNDYGKESAYTSEYTFTNVMADGSIEVTFEEIPMSPGLRKWLTDTAHLLSTEMTPELWKAYIASTDPNDPSFLFEVNRIWKTNGTNFVQWRSVYVDTNLPPFGILATTNLKQELVATGFLVRVALTGSNVVTNTWSEAAPSWPVYYRVVATNNPPEAEEP